MVHPLLKTLLLHPRIEEINGETAFYIDQYTGESIRKRVGLPGFLVQGKSCKEANKCKIYGAFGDYNVLVIFLLHYIDELGQDFTNAAISWVNEVTKQTVLPAPHRGSLRLHGGISSFDNYHREYQPVEEPCIRATDERAKRQNDAKKGGEEGNETGKKGRSLPNSLQMVAHLKWCAANYPDDVMFFTLGVCPKYDVWCAWPALPSIQKPAPPFALLGVGGTDPFISCGGRMHKKLKEDLAKAIKAAKEDDEEDEEGVVMPPAAPLPPALEDGEIEDEDDDIMRSLPTVPAAVISGILKEQKEDAKVEQKQKAAQQHEKKKRNRKLTFAEGTDGAQRAKPSKKAKKDEGKK